MEIKDLVGVQARIAANQYDNRRFRMFKCRWPDIHQLWRSFDVRFRLASLHHLSDWAFDHIEMLGNLNSRKAFLVNGSGRRTIFEETDALYILDQNAMSTQPHILLLLLRV